MLVILHNIRSCHNVGSIFRTADAVGVEKIYLCGITPAPIDRFGRPNQRVCKVSLGAEKSMVWESREDGGDLIRELKKDGVKIIALEQNEHAQAYNAQVGERDYALVLGDEVGGIPVDVLKECDTILEIPMHGVKESLNVSVAFGIAAYQLLNQQS